MCAFKSTSSCLTLHNGYTYVLTFALSGLNAICVSLFSIWRVEESRDVKVIDDLELFLLPGILDSFLLNAVGSTKFSGGRAGPQNTDVKRREKDVLYLFTDFQIKPWF